MRARLLGLRPKGAGDATGLCCVKMMRGSEAAERWRPRRRAYGLRGDPEGVHGDRGAVRLPSQLAA